MADTSFSTLTERMSKTATGWAAVIDGVLNIRTVSHTANAAAVNALYVGGFRILSNCTDSDCDCMVRALSSLMPKAKLVRVSVEVADA